MRKLASEIVNYGKVKPLHQKDYNFNTLDLETIDNELFLIGTIHDDVYTFTLDNFFNYLNVFFIKSIKKNKDILTWSKYDNTFIIKTLIAQFDDDAKNNILKKIGKITPLFKYRFESLSIEVINIIKENIIIEISDDFGFKKKLTIYNLKNLFDSDLLTTATNYKIASYSKLGKEYHIIDKTRFYNDPDYSQNVILSNKLDNHVLIDIATKLLADFKTLTGHYPKTIYTAGSLARSFLLAQKQIKLNFYSMFKKSVNYNQLLNYSMSSYHGGKIESYILGYLPTAKIIDITSAYPFAISQLPKLTSKTIISSDANLIKNFYYAFINCKIYDVDDDLIHPITIPSPLNSTNLSPSGSFKGIITKIEYDYLIERGIKVEVIDFIAIKSDDTIKPFNKLINTLFEQRMATKKDNPALSGLYKTILNSLYGITYELNDVYYIKNNTINWQGYRAGDFFNPVIASYITAITRTQLARASQNILDNGGQVYLNMTDSIIYNGDITLDVFAPKKQLGAFDNPQSLKDVIILGAGRYEYKDVFTNLYTIKSRGFNVEVKNKSFYTDLDLSSGTTIKVNTFVSFFLSTTDKYDYTQLGHLIEEDYIINPFNLGGKRLIVNRKVNLKKAYTTTKPIRLNLDIVDILDLL